jgi:Arabinose efflux permease
MNASDAVEPQASAVPCSEGERRWTLVAAILGSGMAFADGTIVNVALPAIQQAMQATAADAQWVIESYALLVSALLLVGGVLGDRFGRRRMFALGAVVFTLASLACAVSPVVSVLIVARGAQGTGRGTPRSGESLVDHLGLPEGAPGQGDRDVVGVQWRHRRDRARPRWVPCRASFVALGIPDQPSAGCRAGRHLPVART